MKRIGLAGVALAVVFLVMASAASAASPIYLCINEKAGGAVKSGGAEGKCPLPTEKVKYTKVALPREESEQQTLLSILSHAKYVASGVGGKPTIQFSGVNVQIVNGEGKTASVNGEGNLVIGYDENEGKHQQTGSHYLVLGEEQMFTSYGGMLAGQKNSITAPLGSIAGGENNTVSHERDSVSGGDENTASGSFAAWVGGGKQNVASGVAAAVSGGRRNTASGVGSSVSGGLLNGASGEGASIGGGFSNTSIGSSSAVSGGERNEAGGMISSVSGGLLNAASGTFSSIFGGKENKATEEFQAIP
jgi:hypothetical protein